jgi:hypothetical protein
MLLKYRGDEAFNASSLSTLQEFKKKSSYNKYENKEDDIFVFDTEISEN